MNKSIGVGFGIILIQDGKVLLGKRNKDPEKADSKLKGGGTWTLPGGKMDFGETPEAGICRELREETGIVIGESEVKLVSVGNDTVPGVQFITLGFVAEVHGKKPKALEPEEITEWDWFDFSSLPAPLYKPSQKVIENYLGNKIY